VFGNFQYELILTQLKINVMKSLFLVVWLIGSYFFGINQVSAQAGPKAIVIATVKDAGTFYKGDKITDEFLIRNDGDATLNINDVKPACGCTTASFDKAIAPGKTGKIKVVVDLSSFNGPISKGITVYTNDASSPEIGLTIKAKVISILSANPGYARYNVVQGEIPPDGIQQLITSTEGSSFEITGFESDVAAVKATYHEASTRERLPDVLGKQWVVKIILANDVQVGALSGYVHIKTNHAKQKTIDIPISGFVRPLLTATPNTIDYGEINANDHTYKSISVRVFSAQAISIVRMECTINGIEAKSNPIREGRDYQVGLTINPMIAKGNFNGKLIIYTNDNRVPKLEVPIKGKML
jgi:hypothetical protein